MKLDLQHSVHPQKEELDKIPIFWGRLLEKRGDFFQGVAVFTEKTSTAAVELWHLKV